MHTPQIAALASFLQANRKWLISLWIIVAWLGLLMLAMGWMILPVPFLATALVFFLLCLWPGWMTLDLLQIKLTLIEKFGAAFIVSLGLWSIPGGLLLAMNSNINVMLWVVLAVSLALSLVRLYVCRRSSQATPLAPILSLKVDFQRDWLRLIYWAIAGIALILTLIFFASIASPYWPSDREIYQDYISHFLTSDKFLVKTVAGGGELTGRALLMVWILLQALIVKISHANLLSIYIYYLPGLLIPLHFAAMYSFARELFQNELVAWLTIPTQALYIFASSGLRWSLGYGVFLEIIEDKFLLALVLLPLASHLTLRYWHQPSKNHLVVLTLSLTAITLCHPLGLVFYGLAFGLFFLLQALYDYRHRAFWRRLTPIIALMLIMVLIPLWQKYLQSTALTAQSAFEAGWRNNVLMNPKRFGEFWVVLNQSAGLYIFSPYLLAQPLTILAILLTPLLFGPARTRQEARFLVLNILAPLALGYIPGVTLILSKTIGDEIAYRILWIMPIAFVLVFFMHQLTLYAQKWHRLFQASPLIIILVGTLSLSGEITKGMRYVDEVASRFVTREEIALFDSLRQNGIPNSLILTPSAHLDNELLAFVGHSRGMTLHRSLPVCNLVADGNKSNFYAKKMATQEHLELLQQCQIDYVVIENGTQLSFQFNGLPHTFKLLYSNQDYTVYQWTPNQTTEIELTIIRANTALAQGHLTEAEAAYRQVSDPEHPLVITGLAEIAAARHNEAQATTGYKAAFQSMPDNLWLHIRLAELGEVAGKEQGSEGASAIADYIRLLQTYPRSPRVYDEALESFVRLPISLQDSPEGQKFQDLLMTFYKSQMRGTPVLWLEQWEDKLSKAHLLLGHPEQAVASYREYLEIVPRNTSQESYAYRQLFNLLLQTKDVKGAIETGQRALAAEVVPQEQAQWLIELGRAYRAAGSLGEATNSLERAIKLLPSDDPASFLLIADLHLAWGNLSQAETIYQSLVPKLPPEDVRASVGLARVYLAQGQSTQAIDQLQMAMMSAPTDLDSRFILARFYQDQKRPELAIPIYEYVLAQIDPANATAHNSLADALFQARRYEDTVLAYEEAVYLTPDSLPLKLQLAKAYKEVGGIGQALDILRMARTSLAPDDVEAHLAIADTYNFIGQPAQAISIYTEIFPEQTVSGQVSQWPAYDFIDQLSKATMFPSNPEMVHPSMFVISRHPREVLFQHPPSHIAYMLTVPSEGRLNVSLAIAPEVWRLGKGDGVQFDIYADDDRFRQEVFFKYIDVDIYPDAGMLHQRVFSKYIDPKNIPADRHWHDEEVDLSSWAGQTITITFATGCGPNSDCRYDWAGWGEPRIVQPITYNFLTELPEADHGGADEKKVRQDILTIDDEPRAILFQHPSNQVSYHVTVPEQAELRFGLGMDPTIWSPDKGDGVAYSIYVRQPKKPDLLDRIFYRYVDPKHNPDDRRWLDQVVDLSAYGGQTVDIIFEASPGPVGDANFDWGGWSMPMLVTQERVFQSTDLRSISRQ